MPSKIQRPKDRLPWAGRLCGPLTPKEYAAWQFYVLQRRPTPVKPWKVPGRVKAEVRQGRWIALCPQCANGVLVHPEWPEAPCGECGGVIRVTVPRAWQTIERLLEPRPVLNQNWLVGETVADLRSENRVHRVRRSRKGRAA